MAKFTIPQLMNTSIDVDYPREHLGGSIIGHSCDRYLLYNFRWVFMDAIDPKLRRIFRLGDAVETILVNELKRIGIDVINSQRQVGGYKGHGGGSTDGEALIDHIKHLCEFKSMNHANFLAIQRKGVEEEKPQHYRQMQMYMGKLGITRAMYMVMDKNNSDIYIEFVKFDPFTYEMLLAKEESVIDAVHQNLLPKVSHNPSWFQCKNCGARDVCHNSHVPKKNCRTCTYSRVEDNGEWSCSLYGEFLNKQQQIDGCIDWELHEMFSNEA